jgi:hypothetical protein
LPHHGISELQHSPVLLELFLEWWVSAKTAMALSLLEQELVILRMVGRLRSGVYGAFPPQERALLVLTDEMVERRTMSPTTWALHGRPLEPPVVVPAVAVPAMAVDQIALIAQDVLFALTNTVLQLPLESALAAELGLAD